MVDHNEALFLYITELTLKITSHPPKNISKEVSGYLNENANSTSLEDNFKISNGPAIKKLIVIY